MTRTLPDPLRILCVDDEEHVQMVISMCLETLGGYQVSTASNGLQAIEKAMQLKPDAILLDVMMPELDGPATLEQLRRHPELQSIPVIFMTARVRDSEVGDYLALGANGVIPKPFDPVTLPETIRTILERFYG